jgi:opacity protein-like surface antigen
MKKIIGIILIAVSTLAIGDEMYEVQPLYININTGIATGYSFTNNSNNDGQSSGASTNNYSLGANLGYNINQYLATEVGYNQLWLASSSSNSNGRVGIEDIAAKGTIPLGNVFSLYGRAGVAGYQNVDANSRVTFANNVGILYGAGAQWALNKNWSLRAEDWSVTGLGENIIQFGGQLAF